MQALKVKVTDTVFIIDHATPRPWSTPVRSTFQPEFRFVMDDEDAGWAPARSRAPSVTIEFDIFEAA